MVQEIAGQKLEKILIVILAGLGDMVMASPAVKALRNKFPDAKIDLLVLAENEEPAVSCPYINEAFILKRKLSVSGILGNVNTLIKLRRNNFDIAINLYNIFSFLGGLKMFLLLFLVKPKKTLGRNTDGKGFFYNYKIAEIFNDSKHQVERMLDVVKFLGAQDFEKKLEIWAPKEKSANLERFLNNNRIASDDFIIGINPGSHRLSRRWPADNFAILAKELKNNFKAKIVITGSKDELKLAARIKKISGNDIFISSGQFSFSDLVNFIKMCKIFITNDTGPMHVVNALGVPLVAIMGGGAETFYPYNKDKTIILRKNVYCRPCYKSYCGSLECLKAISPGEVKQAVVTLLK